MDYRKVAVQKLVGKTIKDVQIEDFSLFTIWFTDGTKFEISSNDHLMDGSGILEYDIRDLI
jgi:hypothetical protein